MNIFSANRDKANSSNLSKFLDQLQGNTYFIEYLNKDKNFKKDRIEFDSYVEAKNWAINNLEKFNPDMIKLSNN